MNHAEIVGQADAMERGFRDNCCNQTISLRTNVVSVMAMLQQLWQSRADCVCFSGKFSAVYRVSMGSVATFQIPTSQIIPSA